MPRITDDMILTYEAIDKKFPDKFELSAKEVAEFLGCSLPTVYRRVKFNGCRAIGKVKLARQLCK